MCFVLQKIITRSYPWLRISRSVVSAFSSGDTEIQNW